MNKREHGGALAQKGHELHAGGLVGARRRATVVSPRGACGTWYPPAVAPRQRWWGLAGFDWEGAGAAGATVGEEPTAQAPDRRNHCAEI